MTNYPETINGTESADNRYFWNDGKNRYVDLQGGNDAVTLEAGNNTVFGGLGADSIQGGSGNDALYGDSNGRLNLRSYDTEGDTIDGGAGDDYINGGFGNDSLNGGAGNDTIDAGLGNDTVDGGAGNDLLRSGGDGKTLFKASAGQDTYDGSRGQSDTVDFSSNGAGALRIDLSQRNGEYIQVAVGSTTQHLSGIEGIIGGGGADTLAGDARNNYFAGAGGNDILQGRIGDDTLDGGQGADRIEGGDGIDTADFRSLNAAVNVQLQTNRAVSGSDTDTLDGIENIRGTNFNDVITGNHSVNILDGGRGKDTLDGGAGADVYVVQQADVQNGDYVLIRGFEKTGAEKIDLRSFGFNNLQDILSRAVDNYVTGVDTLRMPSGAGGVSSGAVVPPKVNNNLPNELQNIGGVAINLNGKILFVEGLYTSQIASGAYFVGIDGIANNTITGTAASEIMLSTTGNDLIQALDGDDTMTANSGNDTFEGGGGLRDTADYGQSSQGVRVQLQANGLDFEVSFVGSNERDVLRGVENIYGGNGADSVVGNHFANALSGGVGNDTVSGGAGDDTVSAQDGDDSVSGGAGNDIVNAGAGNDSQYGDDGNDVLGGSSGSDLLDGGTGIDWVDYGGLNYGMRVNLAGGSATAFGVQESDSLVSIENVKGTQASDTIFGNTSDNVLDGSGGNDSLKGEEGDDVLIGGIGRDTLDGGRDMDVADYSTSQGAIRVQLSADTYRSDLQRYEGTAATVSGGDAEGDVVTGIEHVIGGMGNDTLVGSVASNNLQGGAGNDFITGVNATHVVDIDRLSGGAGNDTIVGGTGREVIDGGAGNDSLDTGLNAIDNNTALRSTINGGEGDDVIMARALTRQADGGAGNDIITLFQYTNASGGTGNDRITAHDAIGMNTITGGAGNDTIDIKGGTQQIAGNDGEDVFIIRKEAGYSNGFAASVTIDDFRYGDKIDVTEFGLSYQGILDRAQDGASGVTINLFTRTLDGAQTDHTLFLRGVTKLQLYQEMFTTAPESRISGTEGNDVLIGRDDLGDTILGNGGNDDVYANGGNDSVSGGTGDDFMNGGAGRDTLDGGTGSDFANYNSASMHNTNQQTQFMLNGQHFSGIKINMFEAQGQQVSQDVLANMGLQQHQVSATGFAEGDRYISIENIVGSHGGDLIIGDNQGNVVWAHGGHDSVFGNGGNDTLVGEGGNDTLDGGTGWDHLFGGTGADHFVVKVDPGTVDVIHDFKVNGDADKIDLRAFGQVTIYLQQRDSDLHLVLPSGQALIIKNMQTSGFSANDFLTNGAVFVQRSDGVVNGTSGNDVLSGGTGNDTVNGAAGNDSINGNAGNDSLIGGAGNDSVDGSTGDDTVVAGQGADRLDGGAGEADFIEYFGSQAVNVTLNGAASGGDAEGDTLSGFERLGGTSNNDILTGDQKNNTIWGRDGNDLIDTKDGHDHVVGEGGNDTLDGGGGHDIYVGGAGADIFKVGAQEAGAADHIMDFEQTVAGEKIEISGMNNIPNFAALQTRMFQEDGRVRIDLENNQKLYIYNKQINQLSADDFQFVRGVSTDNIVRGTAGDDIINMPIPAANIRGYVDPDGKSVSQSADVVEAGTGNDRVLSMGGNDIVKGQEGNDSLFGGEGDDYLDGGTGDDSLSGQEGDDYLMGGGGKDILFGGAGNDTLDGSGGYDILFAGAGNDVVIMGKAQSYAGVYGEAGNDTFTFNFQNLFNNQGSSVSIINDFTRGQDKIKLEGVSQQDYHGGIVNVEAQYRGNEQTNQQELVGYNITHDYYGGVTLHIRVDGQNASPLTATDFLF